MHFVFSIVFLLTSLVFSVNSWEVYLRELTVFKSHENSVLDSTPEPYLACDNRPRVNLYQVRKVNETYKFDSEQIPVTHLANKECVICTLKEDDIFSSDDVYGAMKLCTSNFAPSGRSEVTVPNEFHAVFDCPQCKTDSNKKSNRKEGLEMVEAKLKNSLIDERLSCEHRRSLSTGTIVLLCFGCFLSGIIVCGLMLKFHKDYKDRKEEIRRRELNYMLSNSEVPFEELPNRGVDSPDHHPVSRFAG
eukprot:g4524.t1